MLLFTARFLSSLLISMDMSFWNAAKDSRNVMNSDCILEMNTLTASKYIALIVVISIMNSGIITSFVAIILPNLLVRKDFRFSFFVSPNSI